MINDILSEWMVFAENIIATSEQAWNEEFQPPQQVKDSIFYLLFIRQFHQFKSIYTLHKMEQPYVIPILLRPQFETHIEIRNMAFDDDYHLSFQYRIDYDRWATERKKDKHSTKTRELEKIRDDHPDRYRIREFYQKKNFIYNNISKDKRHSEEENIKTMDNYFSSMSSHTHGGILSMLETTQPAHLSKEIDFSLCSTLHPYTRFLSLRASLFFCIQSCLTFSAYYQLQAHSVAVALLDKFDSLPLVLEG